MRAFGNKEPWVGKWSIQLCSMRTKKKKYCLGQSTTTQKQEMGTRGTPLAWSTLTLPTLSWRAVKKPACGCILNICVILETWSMEVPYQGSKQQFWGTVEPTGGKQFGSPQLIA